MGQQGHQGLDFPGSVDPSDQKKTACYDIDVEVEEPLKGQMSSFLLSTANQQEISALDSKVGPEPRAGVGHQPQNDTSTDKTDENTGLWREEGEVGLPLLLGAPPIPPSLGLQRPSPAPGDLRDSPSKEQQQTPPPASLPPPILAHISKAR